MFFAFNLLAPLLQVSYCPSNASRNYERIMMRLISGTFPSVKLRDHNNPISKSPNSIKSKTCKTQVPISPSSSSQQNSKVSNPKSWSVYLILSTNEPIKTYVGITTDFARRLKQHNGEIKGGAKASSAGRPWICACLITGFTCLSQGVLLSFLHL
ncbi:hypothetical protein HA466_0271870 [Hirschfeldia incana]|nr:hypothetical protein HA466_0271870 [Hirschfeldia incana]